MSDHEAVPTSETDGSHQAVVQHIVESAEEAAERRKYWSKWYHRASMLVSLLITVALAVISIYGIASVGKLGLPEGLMLFQVVFSVIGMCVW